MSNPSFSLGLHVLDRDLLGGQGLPGGTLLEISGEAAAGKTALALWCCRTAIQQGHVAGWVGVEESLTLPYLRWAGIDPAQFLVARQTGGYSGTILALALMEAGARVVALDSLAALLEPDPERSVSQILSQDLPLLRRAAREAGALLVMTNQLRRSPQTRTTYPVGQSPALVKLLDVRLQLTAGEGLYRGGVQQGFRVHYHVTKNGPRLGAAGQQGRYNLLWREGLRDLRNWQEST